MSAQPVDWQCSFIRRLSPSLKPWPWSPAAVIILHLLPPGLADWLAWTSDSRALIRSSSLELCNRQQGVTVTLRVACAGILKLRRCSERLWRRAVALDTKQDQRGATQKSYHERWRTLTDSFPLVSSSSFLRPRCISAFGHCETPLYLYNKFLFAT